MPPPSNSKKQKVPKKSQVKVGLVPKSSLFWDSEIPCFGLVGLANEHVELQIGGMYFPRRNLTSHQLWGKLPDLEGRHCPMISTLITFLMLIQIRKLLIILALRIWGAVISGIDIDNSISYSLNSQFLSNYHSRLLTNK
jgi:hypothetical protein